MSNCDNVEVKDCMMFALFALSIGCSSWSLKEQSISLEDCWFSTQAPESIEGGIDWGVQASDMNVSYDLPYDGIDQNCDGRDDFDAESAVEGRRLLAAARIGREDEPDSA